ncbi:MAG: hypothetical protein IPK31_01915 [Chitinophagaceae bacterium]|nr:hypothetical protein [Chitinophagaceae bacterium]
MQYTVGKSDYRKDWFFEQLPHVEDPESPENNKMPERSQEALAKSLGIAGMPAEQKITIQKTIANLGNSGKYAVGRSTAWTINFSLPDTLKGNAILRLAICGTGTQTLNITVNHRPAGNIKDLRIDGTPNRSGSSGIWYERELVLDHALFTKGNNTIKLTIPAGQVVNGIMYDYVRLELE